MFWNKKVTLERYKAYVIYVDDRLNQIFRNLDPRTKALEAKLNLILDHLKLKYVPETETKQPAKLVEKTNGVVANLSSRLNNSWGNDAIVNSIIDFKISGLTPIKPKKKGRPKKK